MMINGISLTRLTVLKGNDIMNNYQKWQAHETVGSLKKAWFKKPPKYKNPL